MGKTILTLRRAGLLEQSIQEAALLLLRCGSHKDGWDGTGDSILFDNYVCIWACCEVQAESHPVMRAAVNRLLRCRRADGTWGGDNGNNASIDATARALKALLHTNNIEQEEASGPIRFLLSRRCRDGGWPLEDSDGIMNEQPHIGTTLAVVLALQTYLKRYQVPPPDIKEEELYSSITKASSFARSVIEKNRNTLKMDVKTVLPYTWATRAYATISSELIDKEESVSIAAPLFILLNESEAPWSVESSHSFQILYNTVHALSLLGVTIDSEVVFLGSQWLWKRFRFALPEQIRARTQDIRHLAGLVLSRTALYRSSTGNQTKIQDIDLLNIPIIQSLSPTTSLPKDLAQSTIQKRSANEALRATVSFSIIISVIMASLVGAARIAPDHFNIIIWAAIPLAIIAILFIASQLGIINGKQLISGLRMVMQNREKSGSSQRDDAEEDVEKQDMPNKN